MPIDYLSLSGLLKSGAITAADVALDGELTPKQGRAFVNAIVDHSPFLKRITLDIAGRLIKKRTALDAAKGVLTRHIAGATATQDQMKKLGVVGCTLNMTNGVKLDAQLTDEALEDNQDNANFEKEQYAGFSTVFGNDLLYLGMVGTADNADSAAPFNELAKGWPMVASEDADTVKVTYAVDTDSAGKTVMNALSAITSAAHADIRNKAPILISPEDYSAYVDYIAEAHQNTAVLLSGDAAKYKGRELIEMEDLPQGTFLSTPLKNMVLGVSKAIKRTRWYDNPSSSVRYKFVVRPDFEFDIKKYVTLATAA